MKAVNAAPFERTGFSYKPTVKLPIEKELLKKYAWSEFLWLSRMIIRLSAFMMIGKGKG